MRRISSSRSLVAATAALAAAVGLALPAATPAGASHQPDRSTAGLHSLRGPVTAENFYFVMGDRFENGDTANDTGGLGADRLVSGFDPTSRGFYNGGDLKGLLSRLDYIQGLGTTAIWLTPTFKNKAVQPEDGPSAGYHGYWITDFTQIDPHLGTNEDLGNLVDAAHDRGMKVFFDIITNHTADVVGYEEGARRPYVSKDVSPYQTAGGAVFDDRDYAGTNRFPALDPSVSFPYTPVLGPGEEDLKVPAWLNDLTLYHNRGDTTFVGENSEYGDFFGLDDLFTEHPRVVRGMIDIYQTWIRDFGIDGFRIDTMKHVNDAFWQKFGPEVLSFARQQGKSEFFMFGEVALDGTGPAEKAFTSRYTTHNRMQAVLDFPFKDAARNFASRGQSASTLQTFFANDDWYTDADSNVYQLPTFLGNHDQGRIGFFVTADNAGAPEAELLARDRLAHELMYLSRGQPVVYYGDEQGFTGSGGDQFARQTMFPSQVPDYLDDDLLGTTATHAQSNFVPSHPLYEQISQLAALTRDNPALRDGAHQNRYSVEGPGIYAFSRLDRHERGEYVVALNNSESQQTAAIPTYGAGRSFRNIYGAGERRIESAADRTLTLTLPGLSAAVYRLEGGHIPTSKAAPSISLRTPAPAPESRGRMHVAADVGGSSFNEVTFQAKVGTRKWRSIGTDDTSPYQVFHDVAGLRTGTALKYRAVVLDNGGHTRTSGFRDASVPAPIATIEAPVEGSNVRGNVEVRAVADPERATHVVRFERCVAGGPWTLIGQDGTSPAYTVFDNLAPLGLTQGTSIRYRAILREPDGTTVTSNIRTVAHASPTPATMATLRYFRPAGDYGDPPSADWGLHLFGDAIDFTRLPASEGSGIEWEDPLSRAGVEDGWAVYEIPLRDDTKPVNFIMHLPAGDTVPTTREPGGGRSFLPLDSVEVWLKAGDTTIYTSGAPTP